MTAVQELLVTRPAEDIAADIAAIIRNFHPLAQSRHKFSYAVSPDGTLLLTGHIKSPVAAQVLCAQAARVPGVTSIDTDALFDDETLRLAVGQVLPPGVRAMVDYGRVALSGQLPPRFKAETLVRKVEKIPGVSAVINQLS
jgi:hypothetical protein